MVSRTAVSGPLSVEQETVPVLRPLLPAADALLPYLREIDEARYYTNFGPLLKRFEARLAQHFGVPTSALTTTVNGTTALSAALVGIGAQAGKKCLLPAWTFVASAAAVWAANLVPHFVDVTEETWMPDPAALRLRPDLAEVAAVMIVSPFGSPVDMRAWEDFAADTGIPVIVDAAAGFDTVASVTAAKPTNVPTMVSLHATKVLGIGEGGIILTTDVATLHRVRQISNFGIWGSPEGQIIGFNGKLSEYHCAIGLAALDGWAGRRAALVALTDRYARGLRRISGVKTIPGFGEGWVSSYCMIRVAANVHTIVDRLTLMGIETRRWWQDGVHMQAAYRDFPHDPLPVTEQLARTAVALPFWHDLGEERVTRVLESLEQALRTPA